MWGYIANMDESNSLIEQRKAKLDALRAKGINPFANKFTPGETVAAAREKFAEGRPVALAGRISAHRAMGKSIFIDIKDQTGRIQVYAQKQALGDEQFEVFKHLDLGDFIGVKGTLFTTKTGEISVKLEAFTILAKSLRPPPEKWHGLVDTEIRYRQRYLDLMANDEVKRIFLLRSAVVREIRNFFHARDYVEVETPMMQNIPGGAAAAPFVTQHNALGCNFYLRIAIELYHKRLLVGGIDRIFEIGKNFRNEGLSRKHNPEFTMLEAYQAYGDYETMMELVQSLIVHVAQTVLGTSRIKHDQSRDVSLTIEDVIHGLVRNENLANGTDSAELLRKISQPFVEELEKCQKELSSMQSDKVATRARQVLTEALSHFRSQRETNAVRLEWQADCFEEFEFAMESELKKLAKLSVEKIIDLSTPWRRIRYKDLIRERVRPDWFEITSAERLMYAEQVLDVEIAGRPLRKLQESVRESMRVPLRKLYDMLEQGLKFENLDSVSQQEFRDATKELIIKSEYLEHGIHDFEVTQAVFEKLIEPTLINPTFVTHLPKELVPLAKLSPDDPSTVEVFECCINGAEISPGYSEQNDPIEQRERLEHQAGGEQQKLDEDFLVALEHGMPPAGGIGIGIDRLCMMLLGQESIRDVILFPQMKPKG